jgi:hypothetical protein
MLGGVIQATYAGTRSGRLRPVLETGPSGHTGGARTCRTPPARVGWRARRRAARNIGQGFSDAEPPLETIRHLSAPPIAMTSSPRIEGGRGREGERDGQRSGNRPLRLSRAIARARRGTRIFPSSCQLSEIMYVYEERRPPPAARPTDRAAVGGGSGAAEGGAVPLTRNPARNKIIDILIKIFGN